MLDNRDVSSLNVVRGFSVNDYGVVNVYGCALRLDAEI